MSAGHIIGNRNSTPVESTNTSSLRPPSSRAVGSGHHLRASADMAGYSGSPSASRGQARPSSDFYGTQQMQGQGVPENDTDLEAQQWIADIDQYENTLEEMAAATLDQDFKDELSAIEQWFRVLSEAERTAALYALLQQTTQVQIRFFIQVLQQMGKNHPMSGVLSPANFDKDPMSTRLNDAMGKLGAEGSRNSIGRPPATPSTKRHSVLDPSMINNMFPDAAAAIASKKAEYTQNWGNPPTSNRNSAAYDNRASLTAPVIAGLGDSTDNSAPPASPWGSRSNDQANRPKSSSGQTPMGQFMQPPPSAGGLRSPRPTQIQGSSNLQNTVINAPDNTGSDMPLLSPYNAGNGNWASMVNTPMVPNFNASNSNTDMVANATAMKLAALSTVNNRFALDDVRKYRRARSNDGGQVPPSPGLPNNMPNANVVMINEHGQIMSRDQVLGLQAQQQHSFGGRQSRPSSQNNGFLAAYDGASPLLNNGMSGLSLNAFGMGQHEGYLSDHSEMARGRSPRGRRGSSKPPEDPTDPSLLQDIPSWLRSLRLHKYTDQLKDMNWTELVELDDEALEKRGVNALGARRKMLKVFEQVKAAKAEGKLS
ncbi:SAM domain-containing protein [Botrytis cinerea]